MRTTMAKQCNFSCGLFNFFCFGPEVFAETPQCIVEWSACYLLCDDNVRSLNHDLHCSLWHRLHHRMPSPDCSQTRIDSTTGALNEISIDNQNSKNTMHSSVAWWNTAQKTRSNEPAPCWHARLSAKSKYAKYFAALIAFDSNSMEILEIIFSCNWIVIYAVDSFIRLLKCAA